MKSLAQYFRDQEFARGELKKVARKQLRAGHVMSEVERKLWLRIFLRKLGV
jgi:hypothetical protein